MQIDGFLFVEGEFAVGIEHQKRADFIAGQIGIHGHHSSGVISQRGAHFLRGAEEAVLGGFLGGAEGFADGAEAEPLVVAHFEDHAFARRQIGEGPIDAGTQFAGKQPALRVVVGALFFDGLEQVIFATGGFRHWRLFFADLPFAEVVQADVGDDPVEPGGKTAIEAERVEIAEDAEKCFLVDVFGLFGRPEQVHGDPEDVLIVGLDESGEGVLIALLRGTDERRFVHECGRLYRSRRYGLLDHQHRYDEGDGETVGSLCKYFFGFGGGAGAGMGK